MENIIIEQCYCPSCKRKTNHQVFFGGSNSWRNDEDGFYEAHDYRVVRCCGCDHVSFNLKKDGTAYEQDIDGASFQEPEYISYPEQENSIQPIEDDSIAIPSKVRTSYYESVKAFNAGCNLLAAVGLRMTVEAICNDKKVNGKNLLEKIDNLYNKRIITDANRNRLHEARFLGNESVHDIKLPKAKNLKLVLDVINNILDNLYILEKKCKDTFIYRIKDEQEFLTLLAQGISKANKGDQATIKYFLPQDRIFDDAVLYEYQQKLDERIANGTFKKVKLAQANHHGSFNLYEVL